MTAKEQVTKAKINKWDYIKSKSFCTTKEIISKMKKQPWIGRKHLLTMFLMRLIFNKELTQVNRK